MDTTRIITLIKSRYKMIMFAILYIIAAFVMSVLIYKSDYKNDVYRSSDVEFTQNGFDYVSEKFAMPAAGVSTSVTYCSTVDSQIAIMMNGAYLGLIPAPATGEGNYAVATIPHIIPWSSSDYSIAFLGTGEESVDVSYVEIQADRPLNNDSKAEAIVSFLCMMSFLAFVILIHLKKLSKGAAVAAGILAALVLFVSSPLMADYCLAGHDLWGLCGRIEGIKEAWDCGQIFPVVMPNAFNGYGYLEFMYPELFLLIPAALRFNNVSMACSLHIYEFIINILTAVLTYVSVLSVLKAIDEKDRREDSKTSVKMQLIAMISAAFYLLTQYRLADLYIRAAIGEAVSMTFLPLAIAGLYHILGGRRKNWWMAVIGMSGILHSHILSCAIIVPIVVIFAFAYIKEIIADKRFKEILLSVITFFVVNAWYIIPFIKFYRFGLNTDALIVDDVENHTVLLRQLFSTTAGMESQDYFLRTIGLASLSVIIIAVVYYIERLSLDVLYTRVQPMESSLKLMITISLTFMIFLIGSLDILPWQWIMSKSGMIRKLLSMLQFPFRLLTVSSAALVFILAISLYKTSMLEKYIMPVIVGILVLSMTGTSALLDNYMSGYHSMKGLTGGFEEHVPEDYLPAGIDSSVFEDTASYINDGVIELSRRGTDVTMSYHADKDTVATIPLLYYPCYKAVDENGNKIEIFQSPDKRIGFYLPGGDHVVKLKVKLY